MKQHGAMPVYLKGAPVCTVLVDQPSVSFMLFKSIEVFGLAEACLAPKRSLSIDEVPMHIQFCRKCPSTPKMHKWRACT